MYNIVFRDDYRFSYCHLSDTIEQIAHSNSLEIISTNTTETKNFDMVEVVMESDDRETWRELLSEFPVLTSGRLMLD